MSSICLLGKYVHFTIWTNTLYNLEGNKRLSRQLWAAFVCLLRGIPTPDSQALSTPGFIFLQQIALQHLSNGQKVQFQSFYMQCIYRKRIVFCPHVCKTLSKQPWQEFTPMGPCLIGFLALGVFLGGLWPLKLVTWMFYWKIDLSAISDLKLDHKGNYLNSIT